MFSLFNFVLLLCISKVNCSFLGKIFSKNRYEFRVNLFAFARGFPGKQTGFKAAGDKLLMNKFMRQNFCGGLTLKNVIS